MYKKSSFSSENVEQISNRKYKELSICKNNYRVAQKEAFELMLKTVSKCMEAEIFKQSVKNHSSKKDETFSEQIFQKNYFDDNKIKSILGLSKETSSWKIESPFILDNIKQSIKDKGFNVEFHQTKDGTSAKLSKVKMEN